MGIFDAFSGFYELVSSGGMAKIQVEGVDPGKVCDYLESRGISATPYYYSGYGIVAVPEEDGGTALRLIRNRFG